MKIAILAGALLLPMAAPADAPEQRTTEPQPAELPAPDASDRMNLHRTGAGCVSIRRQVAGEDREYQGSRLDQQPPAQFLLAVDREVDGCREATIVRRDIGPPRPEQPASRR